MKGKSGCEIINCIFYIDGKCTDTEIYVNMETGEEMCRYNSSAITLEEYALKQSRQEKEDNNAT
jgi:hypothetical protein